MGTDEKNLMYYFECDRPGLLSNTVVALVKDAILPGNGGIRAGIDLYCLKTEGSVYFWPLVGSWHFKIPEANIDPFRDHFANARKI